MKTPALLWLALVAAIALVIAGCGGDDSTTTDTGASGATGASGTALTEADFVDQANAICAAGNKELNQAANDFFSSGGQPSQAQLEEYASQSFIPSVQGQIDGIDALTPPESMQSDVDQFVSTAQDGLDQVKDDPSLIAGGGSTDPFADTREQAQQLGISECASDG